MLYSVNFLSCRQRLHYLLRNLMWICPMHQKRNPFPKVCPHICRMHAETHIIHIRTTGTGSPITGKGASCAGGLIVFMSGRCNYRVYKHYCRGYVTHTCNRLDCITSYVPPAFIYHTPHACIIITIPRNSQSQPFYAFCFRMSLLVHWGQSVHPSDASDLGTCLSLPPRSHWDPRRHL
jgi:hypothetical protein